MRIALALTIAFLTAAAQNSSYRYDIKVEMVGLFATVIDRSGKPVTDLTQDDFDLYDQGKLQEIIRFSREYIPLSVVILLDTSGSMEGEKLHNAAKSLIQFLKHLNRGDEATLIEFRARPRILQPFTENFKSIEQDLKNLKSEGPTAFYDAIITAMTQFQRAHNRRFTILLISDAINTYGRAGIEDSIDSLKRHGAELFAIGLEKSSPDIEHDRLMTRKVLKRLTQSAGGEAFVIDDSRHLKRICSIISERMHHQYSFAYYPHKTVEGEWHTIRLEAKDLGYRVISSKIGYFASAPGR